MAISKKAQAAIEDALALDAPAGQVGLGVDIVEIDRIRQILARTPFFAEKVFSDEERAYADARTDPAKHYAARFAAKEAVLKSLGTGFSDGIGFKDVEVVNNSKGRPIARLHGRTAEIASAMDVCDLPLSLSHSTNDAIACVIAITKDSKVEAVKRIDPTEELAKQFKEARGMLDELDAHKDENPGDMSVDDDDTDNKARDADNAGNQNTDVGRSHSTGYELI